MEDLFRGIAIGLGVLMGTFTQGVQPELHLQVHKAADQVVVTAVLAEGVSPAMDQAFGEGVSMTLTLGARFEGRPEVLASRTLEAVPLTREWQVSGPDGTQRRFPTLAEAERAWVVWDDLVVGAPPAGPFVVTAQVTLTFPGRPDWKADMVWKSASAPWRKTYSRLSEIPF